MDIVNCFHENSKGGIGDFIRGSIYLYEECKKQGVDFDIDLRRHEINNFISSLYDKDYDEDEIYDISNNINNFEENNLAEFFEESEKKINEIIREEQKTSITSYICSNHHRMLKLNLPEIIIFLNKEKLTDSCKRWFRRNLVFKKNIINGIKKNIDILNNTHGQTEFEILQKKDEQSFDDDGFPLETDFEVLHFRMGDKKSFYNESWAFEGSWVPDLEDCWKICLEKAKKQKITRNIIVMSDSNELKKFIKLKLESEKEYELPIFIMHEESSHTQKNPNTAIKQNLEIDKSGLYYAVLDMKIASLAKEVTSYSVYFWGSGFINWICKIYDVPITMNIFQEKKI